jgi:hypothetical protein
MVKLGLYLPQSGDSKMDYLLFRKGFLQKNEQKKTASGDAVTSFSV